MTTRQIDRNDLDRLMRQWMDDEARVHEPADLIERVVAGTRRSRQLPPWLVLDGWIQLQLTMRRAAAPRLALMLLLVGLLTAALLAGAIMVGSRPKVPPPFGVAANGRLAFLAGDQIYSVEPDGSGLLQLTGDPHGAATPVFSHDGTRIAYKRLTDDEPADDPTLYGDLVVAAADGSKPVVIDTRVIGMSPIAWSPDDHEVMWTGTRITGGPEQVFVARADGLSVPEQLGNPRTSNWGPNWSPDGTKISYVSGNHFYVMNRDGTDIRRISKQGYAEQAGGVWHPDGSGLIFEAGRPGDHDVWFVGLDAKPERALADSPFNEGAPLFSPDGRWVAFMRTAPDGQSTHAVVIRTNGTDERTLPGSYGWGVVWSPDGTRLLVGATDPALVYELDPFGGEEPRLLDLPGPPPRLAAHTLDLPAWQRLAP